MILIGIDNGSTGSIGILDGDRASYISTPVKRELNYQKTKKTYINRVDVDALRGWLLPYTVKTCRVGLERPMVNAKRFHQTCSAVRAHEATLIILEEFSLPFEYIDSNSWQKMLLPASLKGSAELKAASVQVGIRLWPHLESAIRKHGDADGLLIAEYLKRR